MNQFIGITTDGFGTRLGRERARLSLTLSEFGLLGEVNRMTQMRYESGANFPTIDYLQKIGEHGVDTMYVATGIESTALISVRDAAAFSQAIDLVDNLAKHHNFKPSQEFRIRAVLQIYQQILKFGVKKVNPKLEDLLHVASQT